MLFERLPVMSFMPFDGATRRLLDQVYASVCDALHLEKCPLAAESTETNYVRHGALAALVDAALAGERDPLVLKQRALAAARIRSLKS